MSLLFADLYSGELMMTYASLTSRIAKLILNALMVEKSSSNSNMLLGKSSRCDLVT